MARGTFFRVEWRVVPVQALMGVVPSRWVNGMYCTSFTIKGNRQETSSTAIAERDNDDHLFERGRCSDVRTSTEPTTKVAVKRFPAFGVFSAPSSSLSSARQRFVS